MSGKWKRAALALVLALGLGLTGCLGGSSGLGGGISRPETIESAELQFTHPVTGDTVAVFDTTAGVFRAVLFPDQAPQTCENFIGLVEDGYYNGLTITRVDAGFVVEAGQDAGGGSTTIWNGSGYPPEYTDKLHHYSGALSAQGWRQEIIDAYAAAGGAPYLDYTDTVFGQVYEGMEVVDAIGAAAVDENQVPAEPITINSVTIETYP